MNNLSKAEFLQDENVKGFISYLNSLLADETSFIHEYYHLKSKSNLIFKSLYNAFEQYDWNGDYFENEKKLNELKQNIRQSIKNKNEELAYETCIKILIWGGVLSKNKEIIDSYFKEKTLTKNLAEFSQRLSKEEFDISVHKDVPMNSGFTKIYSLISDNFIIYDSRVGAALALLVKNYLLKNSITKVPEYLNFAYGTKKGDKQNSRNPSHGSLIFNKLSNNNLLHTLNNLKANWLITESFRTLENAPFNNIREIESALFMIGYSVNDSISHQSKLKNGFIENSKNGESFPIWYKIKITSELFTDDFTKEELRNKYIKNFGEIKKSTFESVLASLIVNLPSRVNYYPNKVERKCNLDQDILFKTGRNTFQNYKSEIHGNWEIVNENGKLKIGLLPEKRTKILDNKKQLKHQQAYKEIKNVDLKLNDIPSGYNWSKILEFAKLFDGAKFYGDLKTAQIIVEETVNNFWINGRINEGYNLGDLRAILNVYVMKSNFTTNNPPTHKDTEFLKAIVISIYNLKMEEMWSKFN